MQIIFSIFQFTPQERRDRYQRFYLVDRGRTVNPIRGKAVPIPIREMFTLRAGEPFYQFPLFIGEQEEAVGFSARVQSKAFPLKEDLNCRLNMTFTYGDDDSYHLVFEPIDASVKPIQVHWQREKIEDKIIPDAPAPVFPSPMTWEQLQSWKDPQGNNVNLLDWLLESLEKFKKSIPIQSTITITGRWMNRVDNQGNSYWIAFARTEKGEKCYCNSEKILRTTNDDPNTLFQSGTRLFCHIIRTPRGVSAENISEKQLNGNFSQMSKTRILSFKRKSLQNRIALIWGDGRSLEDPDCPSDFRNKFVRLQDDIIRILPNDIINDKMRYLQACLHKDSPEECVLWLQDKVKNKHRILEKQAIGFALGNLSEPWQRAIFSHLTTPPITDNAIRVFAYAIWRNKGFIDHFNVTELKHILTCLIRMLRHIQPLVPERNDRSNNMHKRQWTRSIAEPLELLLGLLRTRVSSSSDIKKLLQRDQQITKDLERQVERVSDILANKNMSLFSRVQLSDLPPKPEGDRTPDLLYALRLYLTEDDGAHAIEITGVTNEDVD